MQKKNLSLKTDNQRKKASSEKDWTIMIYLAGDNNLSVDMAYTLREMQGTLKKQAEKINLLVYYDNSCLNSPTLYCDFSDFKNPVSIPAASFANPHSRRKFHPAGTNQNAATMTSLYQFVDWCVGTDEGCRNRKASKYALIVSGHGSGIQNLSFLKDDRSDYYMTIPKFRETIAWIKKDLFNGRPLDLVGFDNCVMGMLEIGNELRDFSKVMVASEGYVPNAGWSYSRIIRDSLTGKKPVDEYELATAIVRSFIRSEADYAIGGVSVDMAAWDLGHVAAVTKNVNSLGELLYRSLSYPESCEVLKPLLLQSHYECQSYMFEQNIDLKDFCAILSEMAQKIVPDIEIQLKKGNRTVNLDLKTELIRRCSATISAVERCVLLGGFSGGKYQYSNGISIFFPWTASIYDQTAHNYGKLRFTKKEAYYWDRFLWLYLSAISRRQPKPSSISETEILPSQKNLGFDSNTMLGFSESLNDRVIRLVAASNVSLSTKNTELDRMRDVEGNPNDRVENNPKDRVENNPKDRVENNPKDRVENNPKDRVEGNPRDRVEGNPRDRSLDDTANRILGAIGLTLIDFKNVAEPWYTYGFTRKVSNTGFASDMSNQSIIP